MRRLLNVAYAHLTHGLDGREIVGDARRNLDESLREPFLAELSEKDRKRLEYRRRAREIGADKGQEKLMGAFGMKTTTRGARG